MTTSFRGSRLLAPSLVLGGIAALTASAAMLPGGLLGICSLLLFAILLAIVLRRDPSAQLVILSAFTIRAAAAFVHAYVVALPDSQLDARSFESLAADWAAGGWHVVLNNFSLGAFTYSWLISLPYLAFGQSQLMAQSINVLLGSLVVLNIYKVASYLFDRRVALRLAWVAALFPSLILYSSITMREVFVTYPLTLGLLYLTRWLSEQSIHLLVAGTICFLVSGTFHYAILMCYMVIIVVFFARNFLATLRKGKSLALLGQLFAGLTILPIAVYGVLNYQTDFGRLSDVLVDLPKVLQLVDRVMASRAEGRLAYLQTAQITTIGDFLTIAPLRFAYFLFSPFPWSLSSAADAFLSLDGVLYVVLVLSSLWCLVRKHSQAPAWPIFAAAITMAVVFSFGTSNSGTAFRHRAKIAPLLIAVSAPLVLPRRTSAGTRGRSQQASVPALL